MMCIQMQKLTLICMLYSISAALFYQDLLPLVVTSPNGVCQLKRVYGFYLVYDGVLNIEMPDGV